MNLKLILLLNTLGSAFSVSSIQTLSNSMRKLKSHVVFLYVLVSISIILNLILLLK